MFFKPPDAEWPLVIGCWKTDGDFYCHRYYSHRRRPVSCRLSSCLSRPSRGSRPCKLVVLISRLSLVHTRVSRLLGLSLLGSLLLTPRSSASRSSAPRLLAPRPLGLSAPRSSLLAPRLCQPVDFPHTTRYSSSYTNLLMQCVGFIFTTSYIVEASG